MDHTPGPEQQRRFLAIYVAHYASVYAYARRRVADADDAQDAVAETFTVAWRRLADVPAEAVLPWLYGVARRVLANQRRGNRRRGDLFSRLTTVPPGVVEIEGDVIGVDERRTVLEALGRLKESDQEILRLAVWEELPQRDIGRIVGCTEATVAVRLHRARNRLGQELEKGERQRGHERSGGPHREAEVNPDD